MRTMIEIENKDTILKLVNKLSKQTGLKVKRINTLLMYAGAKQALKDVTILTDAGAQLLTEKR